MNLADVRNDEASERHQTDVTSLVASRVIAPL